jgi:hypothetical protein
MTSIGSLQAYGTAAALDTGECRRSHVLAGARALV